MRRAHVSPAAEVAAAHVRATAHVASAYSAHVATATHVAATVLGQGNRLHASES
jgi:hypothetical protein